MDRNFEPIVRDAHVLTILGNFWPRTIDNHGFPPERITYRVDSGINVVAFEHRPEHSPLGEILFLHGLEGSAEAGYIQSFAQAALERGYGVHRVNLRSCGGTEDICETMYHSGLTSDTRFVLEALRDRRSGPVFLVGFSLGGNVALKLAGELGETDLVGGVCAISTPIDLAACVRQLGRLSNRLYAKRFLNRLLQRIRRKSKLAPHLYRRELLNQVKTIWEFDDRFTAPLFGFGNAANYYETQSASRYLHLIRAPTLVLFADDDPLIPSAVYDHPAFKSNPALHLFRTRHGGHLGFISRTSPRFWLDGFALDWIDQIRKSVAFAGTNETFDTSAYRSA